MKTYNYILLAAGIIMMICGTFIFGHINTVNAVDSHVWGININGVKSFPWPIFAGFVVFMLGVIFYMADMKRTNMHKH